MIYTCKYDYALTVPGSVGIKYTNPHVLTRMPLGIHTLLSLYNHSKYHKFAIILGVNEL